MTLYKPGGPERSQLVRDLARLYTSGHSIRQLATQFDLSYGMIHKLLKEAGITFRARGGANNKKELSPDEVSAATWTP